MAAVVEDGKTAVLVMEVVATAVAVRPSGGSNSAAIYTERRRIDTGLLSPDYYR